jgi:hypothetical protein
MPRDRYLVHIDSFAGESSESQPEAKYPLVYIIKKAD